MVFWVAKFSFATHNYKPFAIKYHPITETLIHWYSGAKRDLPWRSTSDPYVIWISEIILQQTRVEQGLPYFHRFMETFPTIHDLANAPEDEVLAQWQGLGYYSRARNLHFTAKYVSKELKGVFPSSYATILPLKGIGPYTAAAISSFCFGEVEPVVDGNVFRVASRLFGIHDDISDGKSRKIFVDVLKEIIPEDEPGTFNQAMMEYGATVCTPSPKCGECVLRPYCHAYTHDEVAVLPKKTKKLKVKNRDITYLVFGHQGEYLMNKRSGKDIWQGLYDFPIHSPETDLKKYDPPIISEPVTHLLSHQKLKIIFWQFEISAAELDHLRRSLDVEAYSLEQMVNLPKPKIIVDYLQKM